jgi:histone deacetylase 11
MIPLVYSPRYNITAFGLEHLHPFDGSKYRRIHDWLIRQGLRKPTDFRTPRPSTQVELLRIHTAEYLRSLRDRRVLARILEVPVVRHLPSWLTGWRVLRPMRWATGGTVLACCLAVERGLAINLGGGYHHASGSRGGGFCIYADGPLGLFFLRQQGRVQSVLVVDTDAHQGDGTADAIRHWPRAHILDFYEEDLFPYPKAEENLGVPLPSRLGGDEYLELLREQLSAALDHLRPDFVLYNAGSDVLRGDPLTHLLLTAAEMAERDLYVVSEVRSRCIPLTMLLSGGYGPASWEAHAQSIEGILTRFDREA